MVSVLQRGPGGWWWESRRGHQPSLAQVQVPLRGMKTQQPLPTSSAQTGPGGRPGQGGSQRSLPVSLPKLWNLMPSCQQLLSLPSPEAREAAPGFWMGQMAGDRLGGTAEWWKVGHGHLAMPLATQLVSPHGGRVQPRQQAEANVTESRRTGAAPTSRETSPRGGMWQLQGKWKADTTPVRCLSSADAWPGHASGHWKTSSSKTKVQVCGRELCHLFPCPQGLGSRCQLEKGRSNICRAPGIYFPRGPWWHNLGTKSVDLKVRPAPCRPRASMLSSRHG